MTEINNSRTTYCTPSLKERISAISLNKQWEVNGRTNMTPIEEYNAWQEYRKDLERQKEVIIRKLN